MAKPRAAWTSLFIVGAARAVSAKREKARNFMAAILEMLAGNECAVIGTGNERENKLRVNEGRDKQRSEGS